MPAFIPRPGIIVTPQVNPGVSKSVERAVRTVVRSTIIQNRTITKPVPPKVVKRINPPNTVTPARVQPVKVVVDRKKNLIKKDVVRSSPAKIKHDNLVSGYSQKIQALKDSGIGRVLVMVAPGPSINEVELEKLKDLSNVDLMIVNKPDMRVWPTKYWVFCDNSQHKRNESIFNAYSGTIINSSSIRARHRNQILVRNLSGSGFSRDLAKGYYIGRSTTYANMQTALYMNYDCVFILGIDMCAIEKDGKKVLHSYGVNPDVKPEDREKRFKMEAKSYDFAAASLTEDERKKIFICSSYNPWGWANQFNRLDHKVCIEYIINKSTELANLNRG